MVSVSVAAIPSVEVSGRVHGDGGLAPSVVLVEAGRTGSNLMRTFFGNLTAPTE